MSLCVALLGCAEKCARVDVSIVTLNTTAGMEYATEGLLGYETSHKTRQYQLQTFRLADVYKAVSFFWSCSDYVTVSRALKPPSSLMSPVDTPPEEAGSSHSCSWQMRFYLRLVILVQVKYASKEGCNKIAYRLHEWRSAFQAMTTKA